MSSVLETVASYIFIWCIFKIIFGERVNPIRATPFWVEMEVQNIYQLLINIFYYLCLNTLCLLYGNEFEKLLSASDTHGLNPLGLFQE